MKRFEQSIESVVVDFMHQGEQSPDFPLREALPGEPGKVGAGKVSDESAFVFTERHRAGGELLQIFGVHGGASRVMIRCGHANGRVIARRHGVYAMRRTHTPITK